MSAKNRPVSKVSNKNFRDNFGPIFNKKEVPIGEDTRPKDRIKRGLGSACVEENWDCRKGGDV
ncbi:MAG: hypothetical protein ACI9RI_000878 [Oceanospirillaceae bacterium]|jgi:hypothetical protein